MTLSATREARLDRLITSISAILHAPLRQGEPPRVIRRKARVILRRCGLARGSTAFWAVVSSELTEAGILHDLDGRQIAPDTWVRCALTPIEEDRHKFPEEAAIRTFVKKALGKGVFRNLRPLSRRIRGSGKEYRLLNRTRIDLLCEEVFGKGKRGLVAIEFKHRDVHEAPAQMIAYLEQLRKEFPGRRMRGIIITSEEDRAHARLLKQIRGFDIEWIGYRVEFDSLGRVHQGEAAVDNLTAASERRALSTPASLP